MKDKDKIIAELNKVAGHTVVKHIADEFADRILAIQESGKQEEEMLNKLTPLELHKLLYQVLDKLKKLPYVYDKKENITHNNYDASNKQWHYDARDDINELIDEYGKA